MAPTSVLFLTNAQSARNEGTVRHALGDLVTKWSAEWEHHPYRLEQASVIAGHPCGSVKGVSNDQR